jgi:hypothetical protein
MFSRVPTRVKKTIGVAVMRLFVIDYRKYKI